MVRSLADRTFQLRTSPERNQPSSWKTSAVLSAWKRYPEHTDPPRMQTSPRPIPGQFKWTNYDSTGGGVTFGLPACLLFFPTVFRRNSSTFREKNADIEIFWKYAEFRQLSGIPHNSGKLWSKFRRKIFDLD